MCLIILRPSSFNELLLGQILFHNYVIAFDKENQRVGFSNQSLTPLSTPFTTNIEIALYVLVGILTVLCVMGVVICIKMNKEMSKSEMVEVDEGQPTIQMKLT